MCTQRSGPHKHRKREKRNTDAAHLSLWHIVCGVSHKVGLVMQWLVFDNKANTWLTHKEMVDWSLTVTAITFPFFFARSQRTSHWATLTISLTFLLFSYIGPLNIYLFINYLYAERSIKRKKKSVPFSLTFFFVDTASFSSLLLNAFMLAVSTQKKKEKKKDSPFPVLSAPITSLRVNGRTVTDEWWAAAMSGVTARWRFARTLSEISGPRKGNADTFHFSFGTHLR